VLTDPSGKVIPLLAVGAAVWAAAEIGLSIYDAYDTYNTIANPQTTATEKTIAGGLFLAGTILPGGGYSKSDDVVGMAGKYNWGNPGSLVRHAKDHAKDFGLKSDNIEGYAKAANNWVSSANNQVKAGASNMGSFTDSRGYTSYFDYKTNMEGLVNDRGGVVTVFKGQDNFHGDGLSAVQSWEKKRLKYSNPSKSRNNNAAAK